MSDLEIMIQEIARIALEHSDVRSYIGHELDIGDEELSKVSDYLESLMNVEK